MSTWGGLGHFAGYHTQIPVYVPGALHGKKPCRLTSGAAFVAVQSLVLEQQKPSRPDPLYLFHCGLNWSRFGDTSSGWELLQAMRSKDRGARALAAEFLAETENGRLLVRDLRRTRGGLKQIAKDAALSDAE